MHNLSEMDQSYYDTLSKSLVRRPEINYCSDEEDEDYLSGDDHGQILILVLNNPLQKNFRFFLSNKKLKLRRDQLNLLFYKPD